MQSRTKHLIDLAHVTEEPIFGFLLSFLEVLAVSPILGIGKRLHQSLRGGSNLHYPGQQGPIHYSQALTLGLRNDFTGKVLL